MCVLALVNRSTIPPLRLYVLSDIAYVVFQDIDLSAERLSVPFAAPAGVNAMMLSDWIDGKMVGLQVLDAGRHLPEELLAQVHIRVADRARFRSIARDRAPRAHGREIWASTQRVGVERRSTINNQRR